MSKYLKQVEYYKFVAWSALPRPFRRPKTQEEFQMEYQVSHDTLARWKRDENFEEDKWREILSWTKERTPDVVLGLYNRAIQTGDPKAVALWLQLVERVRLPLEDAPKGILPSPEEQTLIASVFLALKNYGVDPDHSRVIEGSLAEPDSQAGNH